MFQEQHILIVDDDERLRDLLSEFIGDHGFIVTVAKTGLDALDLVSSITFDLILLDVMMPHLSGFEVAQKIRTAGLQTPFLFLTALSATEDKIKGLKMGADDYLPKPFEPTELLLRIKAILKRTQQMPSSQGSEVKIGPFFFHLTKGTLRDHEKMIPLTSSEGALLSIFAAHIGDYLSRETLIEKMGIDTNSRTIDVQITRLRKKIEVDPKAPHFLQTVRNKGYVLWDH